MFGRWSHGTGPDNYCPVLVGALGGARWGGAAVGAAQLANCREGVVERCRRLSAELSAEGGGQAGDGALEAVAESRATAGP